jgi:hypothetical protein
MRLLPPPHPVAIAGKTIQKMARTETVEKRTPPAPAPTPPAHPPTPVPTPTSLVPTLTSPPTPVPATRSDSHQTTKKCNEEQKTEEYRRKNTGHQTTQLLQLLPFLASQRNYRKASLYQKLTDLHTDAVTCINGYYNTTWHGIRTSDFEAINQSLFVFENRLRKLPKKLKKWFMFGVVKKIVNDFSESLPLLEAFASAAMQPGHWDQIYDILQLERRSLSDMDACLLRDLMKTPIYLENYTSLEDVAIGAHRKWVNMSRRNRNTAQLVMSVYEAVATIEAHLDDPQHSHSRAVRKTLGTARFLYTGICMSSRMLSDDLTG